MHHVSGRLSGKSGEQAAEAVLIRFVEAVVGVQPEYPIAGCPPQRFVASGGKVITPSEVEDARPQARSKLRRIVLRPGVHYDDLVHERGDWTQAQRKVVRLVTDDHAQRYTGARDHGYSSVLGEF